MAGFEIDIAANAREFQRGTKDVEAALEDVADALDALTADAARAGDKMGDELGDGAKDGAKKAERATDDISDALKDVARDADRAGDKLGDELGDGAKQASGEVDKLEASFKNVADASKRETNKASDSMKKNFDEGTDSAKRDLAELKDEAISNASETFSSFDGSITSLADGIQGTLGGVISNIGPMGAIAGAAAAVGVGLLTAEFERSSEKAAELREQAAELARQIIEAGGSLKDVEMTGILQDWSLELSNNSSAWEFWGDKNQTNLEALQAAANRTGTELSDMFDAASGRDPAAAVELIDDMASKLRKVEGELNALSSARSGGTKRAQELREERDAIEDGLKVLEDRTGVNREATDTARELSGALAEITAADEAAAAAAEVQAEATRQQTAAANALQSGLDEGVAGWQKFMDAEGNASDPAAYLEGMAKRAEATTNFNSNVQSMAQEFGLSQEEVQAILDQGIEFAPMLQSIMDSGLAPEFVKQIQTAVGGGQEIIDGTPLGATVTATADTEGAKADLDATATGRDSTVTAKPESKAAAAELDAVADKKRTATIDAKALTADATRALNALVRRRTAIISASASTWAAERDLAYVARPRTAIITADVRDREGKPVKP